MTIVAWRAALVEWLAAQDEDWVSAYAVRDWYAGHGGSADQAHGDLRWLRRLGLVERRASPTRLNAFGGPSYDYRVVVDSADAVATLLLGRGRVQREGA